MRHAHEGSDHIIEGLKAGMSGQVRWVVADDRCTRRGGYNIFSTPSMVQLLEEAAINAIAPFLTKEQASVGIRVEVDHLAPTLERMSVWAVAVVAEVDRRRVAFNVEIFDDLGKVGQARHDRFVVDIDKYSARLEEKRSRVSV